MHESRGLAGASWFTAVGALRIAPALLGAVVALGCAGGGNLGTGGGGGTTSGPSGPSGSTVATTGSTGGAASTGATTSGNTSGTGVGGAGGSGGAGGGSPGLSLGATCSTDSDCASNLCKAVLLDTTDKVCVTPCTQQSDCGVNDSYFCEPIMVGSTNGYCIPHSPAHCLSCSTNAQCGSLSEECFQAPGDNAKACHVDCSIAGDSACPTDYACVAETINGQPRQVCRPKVIPTCLDAIGGFCDRVSIPQSCVRGNAAGTCLGQRACLPGSKRFDTCSAMAPQCKADCSLQDPAGCTESYCPGATSSPTNCGMCGNVCPGYQQTADNVTCQNGNTCTFSCQGENYDVDNNPANGCEAVDNPQGNHAQASSANDGSVSDCDSGGVDFTLTGRILSDKRVHENAAIVGFDATSGSAPDWQYVIGVGHTFCANDVVVTLTINGSSQPSCYQLNVKTDKVSYSCTTGGTGQCSINHNSGGQFSDDTPVYFEVSKTCSSATLDENVTYSLTGHL